MVLWSLYFLFIALTVQKTLKSLKIVNKSDVHMRASGAFGLIRHYYIEPCSKSSKQKMDNYKYDRIYSGLSVARFLVPKNQINRYKTVTFYTFPNEDKLIYFAATSGTVPATPTRLVLDVLAYYINKYLVLHILFFVVWSVIGKLYCYFKPSAQNNGEIETVYNEPKFRVVQLSLLYLALILIFV